MIAFGIGFALWCIALLACWLDDKHPTQEVMGVGKAFFFTVAIAYIFWGIGWALARIADMIYSVI